MIWYVWASVSLDLSEVFRKLSCFAFSLNAFGSLKILNVLDVV